MSRIQGQQRLIKTASNLKVPDRLCLQARENLESPNRTTKGGRVHVQVGWVLRLSSHLAGAAVSVGVSGSAWCLASCSLSAATQSQGAGADLRRSARKQWRRATVWQQETGTDTNTGTVYSATEADLQRPENVEGERSPSACVLSVSPKVTRTLMHLLTARCY